jgi:hypothetical protein
MSNVVLNILSEFVGRKAFKEADTALGKLNRSVKSLGRNLGISLGSAALINFSRKAVKAFAADQNAALQLSGALKNLGLDFADVTVSTFINDLERTSGVVDDKLRPAMQALLTTTGSVTKSQELLRTAIDGSRRTGIDLTTVAEDLAQAYVGNTRGLRKYNLGLTQAELKSKSFEEIMMLVNKQFNGASAAYLTTYAGKMEMLTTSASAAQEIIGKGLIDSLLILSGNTSVEGLSNDMLDAAENAADFNRELAQIIKTLSAPLSFGAGALAWFIEKTQPLADLVFAGDPTGFMKKPRPRANRLFAGGQDSIMAAKSLKADREALARAKEIANLQKKAALEALKKSRESIALKKLSAIFDMEQIQIMAALQKNITEEERTRLELQLQLAQGNEQAAAAIATQLDYAQNKSSAVAAILASLKDVDNPFINWNKTLAEIEATAKRIASMTLTQQVVQNIPVVSNGSTSRGESFAALTPYVQDIITGGSAGGPARAGVSSTGDVYLTVNGSVVSNEDLVLAFENGLQARSLSGSPSQIGRIAGMFS